MPRTFTHPQFRVKLEAIGFGLFFPVFFVSSGIKFNLGALLASPSSLLQVPIYLFALLAVRGLPAWLYLPLLGVRRSIAAGLFQATSIRSQRPLDVGVSALTRVLWYSRCSRSRGTIVISPLFVERLPQPLLGGLVFTLQVATVDEQLRGGVDSKTGDSAIDLPLIRGLQAAYNGDE